MTPTEELFEIKRVIRQIVTERADNLCWLDVYQNLATFVCVEFDPLQLPTRQFLGNCTHFECSLRTGRNYQPDEVTQRIVLLEKRIADATAILRRHNNPAVNVGAHSLAAAVLKSLEEECADR